MATQVGPPVRTPYRYGLLSTAQISPDEDLRLYSDYQFDSVACHQGIVWDVNCAASFTVTFTRTAATDTFAVTVSAGVVADYTISINGGAAVPLTNPVVITDTPPVTVEICEVAGLQRCVTRTDINPDSPQGTVYTFVSGQSSNLPKSVTEGISNQTADAFVVINGIQCTLIATEDIEQKARDAFIADEQRLVESRYWAQLAASTPTVLAGGIAVPLTQAVAELEAFLRNSTGFTGILHSDAYVAPFATENNLIDVQHPDPQYKRTSLWTPWVFGGGYDRTGPAGEAAPAADQAWIYATGQIVIHRSPIRPYGGPSGGFNATTNQDLAIVERSYVVINDCPIGAILADLDA